MCDSTMHAMFKRLGRVLKKERVSAAMVMAAYVSYIQSYRLVFYELTRSYLVYGLSESIDIVKESRKGKKKALVPAAK